MRQVKYKTKLFFGGLIILSLGTVVSANEESLSMSEEDMKMYAEMQENNPGELYVMQGESSMESVGGEEGLAKFLDIKPTELPAYLAGFPRYIEKIGMVVAIDQMLQAAQKTNGNEPYKLTDNKMLYFAAYVKSLANGEKISIDINANPKMKEAYAEGEKEFKNRRGGRGLSCYSCHNSGVVGMRLRMQLLPDLSSPLNKSAATWPAYRMTTDKLVSLQGRFNQCQNNALLAKLPVGSKEMVGLEVYVTEMSKGQEMAIPGIKR